MHLVDTGLETNTGGRVGRLRICSATRRSWSPTATASRDVDLDALLDHHQAHGAAATVTAVRPPARFGGLRFDGDRVAGFTEKPQTGEGWINGGFMVFEPRILSRLESDAASLESEGLEPLARAGELAAYRHEGFWQCMDTLRDKRQLERAVGSAAQAPWKG